SLGVASGDPLHDGVVLWTRLAPRPLEGGGMSDLSREVNWKVCRSELSQVGRTRTTPAPNAEASQMSFAFASCHNYTAGYYAAYRHMAQQDLDLVFHLGDYIYEDGNPGTLGRAHVPAYEIRSLGDYRIRYGQYKSDPDLQAAHAAAPWVVTMDDHEVENNYADEDSDPDSPRDEFLLRRAAAYQAYYEHQPLRRSSLPDGPDMRLHRRVRYGNLAQFSVLDTRQHRSDQACGGGIKPRCEAAFDPARTMTGQKQEDWLLAGLDNPGARWNSVAQQTLMAELDMQAGDGELFNMDNWAAYVPARERILNFLQRGRTPNPVVLAGDIHATFVNDLKASFDKESSDIVATELACTSISSTKPDAVNDQIEAARPDNPHVKYYNGRERGFVRCDLTRDEWHASLLFLDDPRSRESGISAKARYVIENGRPGAQKD
ncbi:MAG: alkaline phosphatase D family protein, partial [Micromonosporaceae bacterium]